MSVIARFIKPRNLYLPGSKVESQFTAGKELPVGDLGTLAKTLFQQHIIELEGEGALDLAAEFDGRPKPGTIQRVDPTPVSDVPAAETLDSSTAPDLAEGIKDGGTPTGEPEAIDMIDTIIPPTPPAADLGTTTHSEEMIDGSQRSAAPPEEGAIDISETEQAEETSIEDALKTIPASITEAVVSNLAADVTTPSTEVVGLNTADLPKPTKSRADAMREGKERAAAARSAAKLTEGDTPPVAQVLETDVQIAQAMGDAVGDKPTSDSPGS